MASEFTLNARSPYLRGLILHDERIKLENIDATTSSYTEDGAEPSQPTASTARGYMTLEASGTSPEAGYSLQVASTKEGAPVGSDAGGRFRWKKSTDGGAEWRGHLSPNKPTGFEFVRFVASGVGYAQPHATTSGDDVVLVYKNLISSDVTSSKLTATTDAWTHATVNPDGAFMPTVVSVPTSSGGTRVLCVFLRDDLTEAGTNYWTLGLAYSDDGATWVHVGAHLDGFKVTQASWTPDHIRAVFHAGYITLLMGEAAGAGAETYHLVSGDMGASWTEVEKITGNYVGWEPWVDSAGTVRAAYRAGAVVNWTAKASPFASLESDPRFNTAMNIENASVSHSVTVDDAGFLWVVANENGAANVTMMSRFNPSTVVRDADQWMKSSLGATVLAYPIDLGGSAPLPYFDNQCLVPYKSRLLLFGNCSTAASTVDNSLACVHLGGISSVDWKRQTFGQTSTSVQMGYAWFPIEPPNSTWTAAGAGPAAMSANGMTITTTGNARSYSRAGSTSGTPVLVRATVQATNGGSLGNDEIALKMGRADNTVHFDVSLRLNLNGAAQELRLWDNNAGAAVGSDATGLPAEPLDVLVALGSNRVAAYYKRTTGTKWTVIGTGTLTDGGAGTANNHLDWGHRVNGTAGSTWRMVLSSMDSEGAAHGLANFTNPDDLQGGPFSTSPIWVNSGTRLAGTGGPTFTGDTWDAVSRAQYGVQHIHPEISPSPSVMWRSTGTTEALLAWSVNTGTSTRFLSSSMGVALLRPNFRTAFFEGWDGAAWNTIISFDGAETVGASLTYQIDGNHLQAAAGSPAGVRFLEGNELTGGYVELDWSGGGGGTLVAEIAQHSPGVWRDPTAARGVEFIVRSTALATINTPTNARFIPPILVGVRHNAKAQYSAYRLRIPAGQATKEGFYQLGGICAGPLAVFGHQNSWGRTQAIEPNQEIVTSASGARQVRKLGPLRRRVELSWADGWPTNQIYMDDPNPDYIVARNGASYEGIGVREDATILRAILRRQDGALRPVVYLPKIDQATGSAMAFQYSSPARAMYGRIVGPVTSSSVVGSEAQDEVATIDAITIEEEV